MSFVQNHFFAAEKLELTVVIDRDGKIWFRTKELARFFGLHHQQTSKILNCISKDNQTTWKELRATNRLATEMYSMNVTTTFVNEPGIFQLAKKSKRPNLLNLQNWIFEKMIPQIYNSKKAMIVCRKFVCAGVPIDIRVYDCKWFLAKDITGYLGYTNTTNAVNKHVFDKNKITWGKISASYSHKSEYNWHPETLFVNKIGLRQLIMETERPDIDRFRYLTSSFLLPLIRRNKEQLQIYQEKCAALEKQIVIERVKHEEERVARM